MRSSPSPPTNGCLSNATSETGASSSAAALAMPSSSVPAGVADSGLPALSSASIPQRASKRRYARRQLAIRRDQRRGLAGRLQRFAQRKRNRQRLGRGIGELGKSDAAQAPFGGPKGLPFVREIRRRHRIGDGAAARRRRCRHLPTIAIAGLRRAQSRADRAAASNGTADASLRHACLSSGPSASHSSSGKTFGNHRPGSTTIPPGIRATRATSAATAGADVVIPAATVKPAGGSSAQRSAMR